MCPRSGRWRHRAWCTGAAAPAPTSRANWVTVSSKARNSAIREPAAIADSSRGPASVRGSGSPTAMSPSMTWRLATSTSVPSRNAATCSRAIATDNWTYQFAVVVDDLRHQITHVVRGADLLESTGRQVALARLLGREHGPVFLHHPIIHGEGGAKLSKRDASFSLAEMRKRGMTAAEVIAAAGCEQARAHCRAWAMLGRYCSRTATGIAPRCTAPVSRSRASRRRESVQ